LVWAGGASTLPAETGMPTIDRDLHPLASRRSILGGAGLLAGVAAGAAQAQPAMRVKPGRAETRARTSLHQEIAFDAAPARIYAALLASQDFASFSGMPAQIDPRPGGAFSLFGGMVVGRNIELVPDARIVQAWRVVADFPAGVYSLVKMELVAQGRGTRLVLDHTGFPEGHFDHLDAGWAPRYWTPLRKFLG
jgi:activator of HSP90 ATPase